MSEGGSAAKQIGGSQESENNRRRQGRRERVADGIRCSDGSTAKDLETPS